MPPPAVQRPTNDRDKKVSQKCWRLVSTNVSKVLLEICRKLLGMGVVDDSFSGHEQTFENQWPQSKLLKPAEQRHREKCARSWCNFIVRDFQALAVFWWDRQLSSLICKWSILSRIVSIWCESFKEILREQKMQFALDLNASIVGSSHIKIFKSLVGRSNNIDLFKKNTWTIYPILYAYRLIDYQAFLYRPILIHQYCRKYFCSQHRIALKLKSVFRPPHLWWAECLIKYLDINRCYWSRIRNYFCTKPSRWFI